MSGGAIPGEQQITITEVITPETAEDASPYARERGRVRLVVTEASVVIVENGQGGLTHEEFDSVVEAVGRARAVIAGRKDMGS